MCYAPNSQKYILHHWLYKGKYLDSQKQITNIKILISQKYTALYKSNITFVYQTKTVNTKIYL